MSCHVNWNTSILRWSSSFMYYYYKNMWFLVVDDMRFFYLLVRQVFEREDGRHQCALKTFLSCVYYDLFLQPPVSQFPRPCLHLPHSHHLFQTKVPQTKFHSRSRSSVFDLDNVVEKNQRHPRNVWHSHARIFLVDLEVMGVVRGLGGHRKLLRTFSLFLSQGLVSASVPVPYSKSPENFSRWKTTSRN